VLFAGVAALIELVYHLQLESASGSTLRYLGLTLDSQSIASWLGALAVAVVGAAMFEAVRRRFAANGAGSRRDRGGDDLQGAQLGDPAGRQGGGARGEPGGAMSTAPAVELKGLRKSFGKTEIIRGCDLAVAPGERVAIIGPNGAGKSTLFNLISGRLGPTSGEILLNGKRIDGLLPYEINRRGLARSFQITNIFGHLSVFENLRCGLLWSMGYRYAFWKFLADLRDANERAEELTRMIRLERKHDTLAMNLTYAEQRALEIGITIAGGAEVILLDEPTAGMSKSRDQPLHRADPRRHRGKTLLTVEHDMGVVFGLADKIAVLVYGEVIAFDKPDAVRANARVQEAYPGSVLADAQAPKPAIRAPGSLSVLLQLKHLEAYYGKSHILHGVDMHVGEGEIVSLLGRNGSGRSTTVKTIMGLVHGEGSIKLRDQEILGQRTFEIAHRGIGYVPRTATSSPSSPSCRTCSSARSGKRRTRAGRSTTCTRCSRA
jgi:branched-chain amino acid transport system ATP-binding protein